VYVTNESTRRILIDGNRVVKCAFDGDWHARCIRRSIDHRG